MSVQTYDTNIVNLRRKNYMATIYDSRGYYLTAIKYWKKVLELDPSLEEVNTYIAESYYEMSLETSDPDEAIEYYEKAAELEPEFAEAYFKMGILYNDKKCYGKALECWEKAIELDPSYEEELESDLANVRAHIN
jgi:superkiller protein 3